jgi:hypothetical protein
LELVGLSYTSLSLADFSVFVGLTETEALALAHQQLGWKFEDSEK